MYVYTPERTNQPTNITKITSQTQATSFFSTKAAKNASPTVEGDDKITR